MSEGRSETGERRPGRRRVRNVTAKSLENAATHYLQRFSASSATLRQVLLRRIERARRAEADVADDAEAAIEAIIEKFQRLKLIDDAAFAAGRAAALRRRGTSRRFISGKLRLAGIDEDGIEQAIAAADSETAPLATNEDKGEDEDGPQAELRAALRLAQRRRLGPWRPHQERAAMRQRDLASLARAGFSLDIARRVLETDPE